MTNSQTMKSVEKCLTQYFRTGYHKMNIKHYSIDQIILSIIILLSGFGIVMMYSASSIYAMNRFENYLHFFEQQIMWLILGLFLMYILTNIHYKHLRNFVYILMVLSWLALIMGYYFKGPNPAARWRLRRCATAHFAGHPENSGD